MEKQAFIGTLKTVSFSKITKLKYVDKSQDRNVLQEDSSPYFIIDTHCYFSATKLHIRNGVNLAVQDW